MSRLHDRHVKLTDEEAKIIDMLQKGISQKEIAHTLGRDESTISKKIKDLKEEKIIKTYPSALVDTPRLVRYIVYGFVKLRLPGREWESVAEGISRVSERIVECTPLFGSEWDILLKCYVNSLDEYYDDIVKQINLAYELHAMRSAVAFRPAKYDPTVTYASLNIQKERESE